MFFNEPKRSRIYAVYKCKNDFCLTVETGAVEIAEMFGYTPEEFQSCFHGTLSELIRTEDREDRMNRLAEQLKRGDEIEVIAPVTNRDGTVSWIMNRAVRQVTDDGQDTLAGVLMDITRSKIQYDEKKKAVELYQILLNLTENVIFEWDCVEDRVFFSNSWEDVFGYVPQINQTSQVISRGETFHPDDVDRLMGRVKAIREGEKYQIVETRIWNADGRYVWCKIRETGVYNEDGSLQKIIGMILDIDEQKQEVHALKEQAERDSLTKIYNARMTRNLSEEYLNGMKAEAKCAIMIIDLDDFKKINDQYGHMYGDSVLTNSAQIIRNQFRSKDIVGRIGGEEFFVLMKDIRNRDIVTKRCNQILDSFRKVFGGEKFDCNQTCSIGVAVYPQDGMTYTDLFCRADQALYQAKNQGKDRYVFYEASGVGAETGDHPGRLWTELGVECN